MMDQRWVAEEVSDFWGVSSPLCVEKTNGEVNISHETTTNCCGFMTDIYRTKCQTFKALWSDVNSDGFNKLDTQKWPS